MCRRSCHVSGEVTVKLRLLACLLPCLALLPATAPASAAAGRALGHCTVVGTAGSDVLVGTRRADVLCGLGGDDVLRGRGADDVLLGGAGDDHLAGGHGRDRNQAGDGDDTCVYDDRDQSRRSCAFDHEAPVIHEVEVLTPAIDVSEDDARIVVRVHVTDDAEAWINDASFEDSRVDGAVLHRFGRRLVEGTVSDGWWEIRRTVPEGFPASRLSLQLRVSDPGDHHVSHRVSYAVRVTDADPHALPEVAVLQPSGTREVDARGGVRRVDVTATVRVPESEAVGPVGLCLEHVASTFVARCAVRTSLVSGDRRDGVWTGTVRLRPEDLPGEWTPSVRVADRARPDVAFHHLGNWGAGYRWTHFGGPWVPVVAGGAGVVDLRSSIDDAAPVLTTAQLPTGSVTRDADGFTAGMPVEVVASDVSGSPVESVTLVAVPLGQGVHLDNGDSTGASLAPAAADTWGGSLRFSPYDPDGAYALVVRVADGRHLRYYGGDSAAAVTRLPLLPLPGNVDPVVTVDQAPAMSDSRR